MPTLTPLHADHAPAVLAFETANRAYFARTISDRGDAFFDRFDDVHRARLTEQETGAGAYYLLVDDDGAVLGRFNLILAGDGTAELGYRMAEAATGRGLATSAVRDLCRIAVHVHGLTRLRAATSETNLASRRVLLKSGFHPAGPADPAHLGGKAGTWYARELTPSPEPPA